MFDDVRRSAGGNPAATRAWVHLFYRPRRGLLRAAFCSLAVLCSATYTPAQVPVEGALRGVTSDLTAHLIADAQIRITDATRGLLFTTQADAHGEFYLAHLPAGTYDVVIAAPGFATLSLDHVTVEGGGIAQLSVHLSVAGVRQQITVTDQTLDTTTLDEPAASALTSVVAATELDTLPLNARQWKDFALLMPGINAADADSGAVLVSARGLATTQNINSLDGLDDSNSFHSSARGAQSAEAEESRDESAADAGAEHGGAHRNGGSWRRSGATYTFSQAAIREFRVSTQNYSALYGHGAGASIVTLSKSGTNVLHGSGFYMARTSALDATNPFSIATHYRDGVLTSSYVKPHDLRQQFGGTLGGPAIHDRLFYFYAYDQQRRGFAGISSPDDPAFYALTATQRALLLNRGVKSAGINAALNYLDSLTGNIDRRDDQTINFIKLDWQATTRNRISVQYNRLRSSVPGGLRGAAVVDRGTASIGSGYTRVDSAAARWSWSASSRFNNELRFAYGHDLQFERAQTPLPQEPAIGLGGMVPQISVGPDGLTFGTPSGVGRRAYPDERRTQLADTVSWSLGHHLLQTGVEFSAIDDTISALDNTVGSFRYDSGATNGRAGGLVDWITDYTFNVNAYPNGGCPSINAAIHLFCFNAYTQSFGEETVAWKTQDWAAFIEENWHVARNLSINVGVRYEYQLLPLPQRPNAALDAVFSSLGATSIFPEDRNNFGPRFGLAWAPFGSKNGIIRIGYGLYYGRVPGATVKSALTDTALAQSSTHIRITPSTVINCPQVANQGFGYVCAYVSAPPAAIASTTSATVFSRRFRTPLVQQGSLSLERSIGRGAIVSATYLLNIDRQLQGSVDLNIAPSTATETFQLVGGTNTLGVRDGDRFSVPIYTSRLNNSFGPVTAITSNVNASYNALALEARRRLTHGLDFRAAWIWSKAIDTTQSTGATPSVNSQFDPFNIRYDKGLSRLNFPQKLVISAAWSPSIRNRERAVRVLANGWTASGVMYLTSGRPYSYEISGGDQLTGGHQSINAAGGAIYLPTVGRNTLRLPATARLDLRLSRSLRIGERLRARANVEAFNLFNRVNYSGVQQRAFLVGTTSAQGTQLVFQDAATIAGEGLNTRPFGAFTEARVGTGRERQIQFGLKLEF